MEKLINMKHKRQKCEVYSRIVGYLRPISQWNDAKIEEYKSRVNFGVSDSSNVQKKKTTTASDKHI